MYHLLYSAVSLCPFQLFLHMTRSSRAPSDSPILWSRRMHFIPSLSGPLSLHGLTNYGAMLVGTCDHTSSLGKGLLSSPGERGWGLPTHPSAPSWRTQRNPENVCCWSWKGAGNTNQNKSPPGMAAHHQHWEYWVRWNWKPPFVCWSSSHLTGNPCSQARPSALAWALPGSILDDLI